jgi:hypothetical protein
MNMNNGDDKNAPRLDPSTFKQAADPTNSKYLASLEGKDMKKVEVSTGASTPIRAVETERLLPQSAKI